MSAPEPAPTFRGWRVLVACAVGLALGAALPGLTLLGLRLLVVAWTRAHLGDAFAIVLFEAYLGILVGLLAVLGPRGVRDQLAFRFTSPGHVALALGAWVAAVVAAVLLTAALVPFLGKPDSNAQQALSVGSDPFFVVTMVITICVLGPVAEELLFRGALYGWMARWSPPLVAILLSSVVFAAVHLIPTLLPFLFVLGVAAGLVRWVTGSTVNSLVVHACQNTLAVVVVLTQLR